jgi:hypothetical protein
MYPTQRRPKVFHWIGQAPTEEGSPSLDAKAIRRCYVNMWLDAAQAVSSYWELPPKGMPVPSQERLFTQLSKGSNAR